MVHDFENNHLMLFKEAQYSSNIRSAYEDLLCIVGISRVFQIALRSARTGNFAWGIFLSGGGNLRGYFDHLNLLKGKKNIL